MWAHIKWPVTKISNRFEKVTEFNNPFVNVTKFVKTVTLLGNLFSDLLIFRLLNFRPEHYLFQLSDHSQI